MSIQSNVTENPTVAKVKAEATAEFNGLMKKASVLVDAYMSEDAKVDKAIGVRDRAGYACSEVVGKIMSDGYWQILRKVGPDGSDAGAYGARGATRFGEDHWPQVSAATIRDWCRMYELNLALTLDGSEPVTVVSVATSLTRGLKIDDEDFGNTGAERAMLMRDLADYDGDTIADAKRGRRCEVDGLTPEALVTEEARELDRKAKTETKMSTPTGRFNEYLDRACKNLAKVSDVKIRADLARAAKLAIDAALKA